MTGCFGRFRRQSLTLQCAIFCGLAGVASIPVCVIAFWLNGPDGIFAALVAAAVCAVSGICVLISTAVLKQRGVSLLVQMAVAAFLRSGMALGAALVFLRNDALLHSGALYYLVVLYVLMLWIEVALLLPDGTATDRAPSK